MCRTEVGTDVTEHLYSKWCRFGVFAIEFTEQASKLKSAQWEVPVCGGAASTVAPGGGSKARFKTFLTSPDEDETCA